MGKVENRKYDNVSNTDTKEEYTIKQIKSESEQKESEQDSAVHKPKHYNYSKYEPRKVIREWDLNCNLGSAVKYIARAGRKDDIVQDLKKAIEFLSFEIEYLEEKRLETGDNNYGNIVNK